MNEENLKRLSPNEARENGSKGGKASAEVRRRKKCFKEVVNGMLAEKASPELVEELARAVMKKAKKNMTLDEAIAVAQIIKAIKGDTQAATWVRDTAGEKPTDKIEHDAAPGVKITLAGELAEYAE